MDAKEIIFGGKKYLVSTNNSGELSNSDIAKPENQKDLAARFPKLNLTHGGYTPELIKIISERPHVGRSSNGKIQIRDDATPTAHVLTLGMKALTNGENVVDRGGSKYTEAFWKDVARFRDELAPETQKVVDAELASYQTKEAMADEIAKLRAELAKLQKKSK